MVPDWEHEIDLCAKGHSMVAGVDEVGRGAWAGPLVAGAVILPSPDALRLRGDTELLEELACLRDSKMLTRAKRERLLETVKTGAVATGIGLVSARLVDLIGLGPANRLAMARAVRALGVWPSYLVIDAFKLPAVPIPQKPIIRGDATCISIAAASVVAKVARDKIMDDWDAEYPGYGFASHKGYGTRAHIDALRQLGVSPLHRRSYAPIKAMLRGEPWPLEICADDEEPGAE
ncbi:MAG: ribonuclease HII [Chloroflexota bacterium]|nr:ribonuclease HII [Chloroflexota bacterium]